MVELRVVARPDGKSARPSRDVVLIAATIAVLSAVCIAWVCWRACFHLEIDGNEAWNAWHADDAYVPSRLYPPIDALINNNYPPLSFLVLHSISPLFANTIAAGRFLSIFSLLVTAGAVFSGARNLGADGAEAAVGGAWFVATICLFFSGYAGMNDPNLFGLAITACGFALFLGARTSGAICAAFALMAVAGFVKQNLIAPPLCAFLCLAFTRPAKALRVALFGLGLCAAMLGVASAIYGSNFLTQMLAPRQLSLWEPWLSLRHLAGVAPVWPFWLLTHSYGAQRRSGPIVGLLGAVGLLSWAFWRMGAGVDENAQFELVFATALAVAMAFNGLRATRGGQWLFGAVLVARLLTAAESGPWHWLTDSSYRAVVSANSDIADREIQRVRDLPGSVTCSMQNICYMAGKAFVFNDFTVEQRLLTGRARQAEIDSATRNIRFETIDARAHWRP